MMTLLFLRSRYGWRCCGTSIRYSQGKYLCFHNSGDYYFDGDETDDHDDDDVDNLTFDIEPPIAKRENTQYILELKSVKNVSE